MGWDASAILPEGVKPNFDFYNPKILGNDDIDRDFEEAEKRVLDAAGRVDGDLRLGGLDCSTCAYMIAQALGGNERMCWEEFFWDADTVQSLVPDWDFAFEEMYAYAYHSAKEFIAVCQKHRLGILFDY